MKAAGAGSGVHIAPPLTAHGAFRPEVDRRKGEGCCAEHGAGPRRLVGERELLVCLVRGRRIPTPVALTSTAPRHRRRRWGHRLRTNNVDSFFPKP